MDSQQRQHNLAKNGRTEVYNEAGLRAVMREYLTDESRARFQPGKFMDDELYASQLKWLMEGLMLFLHK